MIKQIVSCGALISIISYGNVFGTTTLNKCCVGSTCSVNNYIVNCKSCTTNEDCGLSPGLSSCPDECPDFNWTVVSSDGLLLSGTAQYEVRCSQISGVGKCQYQCHSGSYGNPTSSSSGCTICPSVNRGTNSSGGVVQAVYGASESGATDITGCYAKSDTAYHDSTGTYKFSDKCYYTK